MTASEKKSFDLTSKVAPNLDPHMILPLLDYLDSVKLHDTKEIAAARLEILKPTHMVDYAMEVYKVVNGKDAPSEMNAQKDKVLKELEGLRKECSKLSALCQDQAERTKLSAAGQWNSAGLASLDISAETVETYKKLGRYSYDCGDYKTAQTILADYISLFAKSPRAVDEDLVEAGLVSNEKETLGNPNMYYLESVGEPMLQTLWGRLSCDILEQDWTSAATSVDAVKTALESLVSSNVIGHLEALQQRTWLLHWSLFCYWNGSKLHAFVDLCFSDRYKQAITTNAPHLIRYLVAAVLLGSGSKKMDERRMWRNLSYIIQDCDYTDPIVDFIDCLIVKYDFETSRAKLTECQAVLDADFFLCRQEKFMEEARILIFEHYCRMHHKIDLASISKQLDMNTTEAEAWMVELIRRANLDAKIDDGNVIMGTGVNTVYQQVADRTRDLNIRSAILAQNLNNLLGDARKEKQKRERASMEE